MTFPTTLDTIIDGSSVITAAHVKTLQDIAIGPVWINVKAAAYGALGNDTGDDSVAINAAIATANLATYGGTVYLPEGTYRITNIVHMLSNVTLRGAGRRSIIHNAQAAAQPTIINNSLQSYNANRNNQVNITVRDLAISGTTATQLGVAGACIYMAYVQGVYITGVFINGCNSIGILINKCIDATVTSCEVIGTAGGIWTPESDSWIIANNRIYNPTDDAIATYGGDGAQGFDVTQGAIVGNIIHDNGGANAGITVDIASVVTVESKGVYTVSVVGNSINTSASHGIIVGGNANDVVVSSNTIKAAAFNGIWVSDRVNGAGGPFSPKGISIHDNILDSCGNATQIYAAIIVDSYTTAPMVGVSIRGNKIRFSRNAGIMIHAYGVSLGVAAVMRQISISDNFIQDTSLGNTSGIYIQSDGNGCIIEDLLIANNQFYNLAATQTYCMQISSTGTGLIRRTLVIGNDVETGFVTAAFNIFGNAGSTVILRQNKGYNKAQSLVATGTVMGASPFTLTNTYHVDCMVYILTGTGTISSITVGGSGIGLVPTGQTAQVKLLANDALVITWATTAPTYGVIGE